MDFDLTKDFNELYQKFINETAADAVSKLSKKDRKALLEHPDPLEHHFGYGMYIRNHYIRNKELPFLAVSIDRLSTEIVEEIIRRVQEEASEAG
jgi:hypothetical protein